MTASLHRRSANSACSGLEPVGDVQRLAGLVADGGGHRRKVRVAWVAHRHAGERIGISCQCVSHSQAPSPCVKATGRGQIPASVQEVVIFQAIYKIVGAILNST